MTVIEAGSAPAQRLLSAPLAWLTTVRPDGQPQSSYVWFHFDGSDLLVFSQAGTPKIRNVQANPRVSFHLDGDGLGGEVVTIDATAEILSDDPDPDRVQAFLVKYDDAIRTHLRTTPEQMRAQFGTTLRITPTRIRSW